MSSGLTLTVGNQKPRLKVSPKYIYTDADNAVLLASEYDINLDEWQYQVLCAWLGKDRRGQYTSIKNGLSVPRQNGKNFALIVRELFGALIVGERILHTAHEYSTAMQHFDEMQKLFGTKPDDPDCKYPELNAEVSHIRQTNGKEAIFLKNGGRIYFSTRTKAAKRGWTVDVVVFDESQELSDTQLGSLMSTASAAPLHNPQYIFTGTPPGPDAYGAVFRRTREAALKDKEERCSWFEWSVDALGDVKDRDRWYATNPALGIRLNLSVVEAELGSMTEDIFAIERLGWWSSGASQAIVAKKEWDRLKVKAAPEDGKLAYGIQFSPDGAMVSLSVAVKPAGEKAHLEGIHHRSLSSGTAWLVKWIASRWRKSSVIVIDGLTGASALAEALLKEKVPKKVIVLPKSRDKITACAMTLNAIHEKTITHSDQDALNFAVYNARKRPIGAYGGWGWGGIEDADVTLIEACSLAYWGVMTSKRNPARKQRLL
jgi:phage terminase large subunit-like protein